MLRTIVDVGAFRYICRTRCVILCTSLSLSVRTVICHNLLTSTLTRLCKPLCMGRDAVSLVPGLSPKSTNSNRASHSGREGAPCSSVAVAAACPHIRATAEPDASEGLQLVFFFCCGASRPPIPSVEARRGLHVCFCWCSETV